MIINVKVNLTNEEQWRWQDAYAIMSEVYEALPHDCEAEATIKKAITYFEEFNRNYMED